jgi:hypothetical protein
MKKLCILTIVIFGCTFLLITARQIKTRKIFPAPQTRSIPSLSTNDKPSPQYPSSPSTKTYKQLLDDIAHMRADRIVAPDGIFTDYFITFVKDNAEKSQLSDIFTKALLEAGMTLHAPLSENNTFTERILKRNSEHIQNIINSLKPAIAQDVAEKQLSQEQKNSPITQLEPVKQQLSTPTPQPVKSKEPNPQPTPSEPKKPIFEQSPKLIKQKEQTSQPIPQKSRPVEKFSGPAGLKEFRKQTVNEPLKTFYSEGKINREWLIKALDILLAGQPLTSKNKEQMQGELVGNATELIREVLHKNQIASNLWNLFLEDIKKQTIAFINSQPLSDQKQLSQPTLPAKTPQTEPMISRPKKPTSEPQPKTPQKPDKNPSLPDWMTPENTLIIKELEIEILRYIFENPKASQETITQYFTQQIPKNIQTREILINGIKATIGMLEQEPLEPNISAKEPQIIPQKTSSKDTLPYWIDPKHFNIKPSKLDQEIAQFIATNMDADTDAIANHFIGLIPHNISRKKLIESQIRATIEDFLAQ